MLFFTVEMPPDTDNLSRYNTALIEDSSRFTELQLRNIDSRRRAQQRLHKTPKVD